MEKPEMIWIDKLFNCMTEFYGERWTSQFDKFMPEPLLKTIWQSALTGCNYDEIRSALVLLKRAAQDLTASPPHHLEFFCYAKGTRRPSFRVAANDHARGDLRVARETLDEINAKIRYRPALEI